MGSPAPSGSDLSRYPPWRLQCLRMYLAAVAPGPGPSTPRVAASAEEAVPPRKNRLVEQMAAILGPEVRAEAAAFVAELPLAAEWEGAVEGPLREANHADGWLKRNPGSSLAPFLLLFKAHRLRAAYETGGTEIRPLLAEAYRETLRVSETSPNPLIRCLAEDLEAQPFVYLPGRGRPGEVIRKRGYGHDP